MTRIDDKVLELKGYLEEFSSIEIPEFEEYKKNFAIKATGERYFEKIIEAIISITTLIIQDFHLTSPETEEHALLILAKGNFITTELASKLMEAKDMRNIIVHNYKIVEDEIVFNSIEEIVSDANEFIAQIEKHIKLNNI